MPQLDLGKVVGDTGPQGPKGDQGIQGPAGQTGPGVAVGGSANQVLVKHSGTNYDTQWVDAGNLPSIAGVQDSIAIVANGDTHPAIASGQFVYVRNHSTLAEGLYKATAAIGTDVALTTSNLTADGSGGLNDLKGQIDSLNSKITGVQSIDCTFANTITPDNFTVKKIGKLVIVCGGITSKTSDPVVFNNGEQIITGGLPNCSYNPVFMGLTYMSGGTQREQYRLRIVGGTLVPFYDSISVPRNGMALYVNICYFTDN